MKTIRIWLEATRPKTLFASICPVLIGLSISTLSTPINWPIAIACLSGAICIQIATNFANDYYDYIKGADTSERKGPTRATQAGLITPQQMKHAFIITFALAALISLYLIQAGGLPILAIAIASIAFGVLYTGGPYPLAYTGIADLFVFVFFGPIAVMGTVYLQTSLWTETTLLHGIAPGLISTAILAVNNLRDVEEDKKANKKTLTVRFGKVFSQIQYTLCMTLACLLPFLLHNLTTIPSTPIAILAIIPSLFCIKAVTEKTGEALNAILAKTGKILLIYTLLFATTLHYFQ